jgi:hypothetical protein
MDVNGQVSEAEQDCVHALVSAVLAFHGRTAGHARVRVTGGQPGGVPAVVQVNLRVGASPARVQVAGESVVAAASAVAARLHRQVGRLAIRWQQWGWPDPEHSPLFLPGRAQVVRTKAVALNVGQTCQAAATMQVMDYDAYLFTDGETGEDAVVYRSGPHGLCLARQHSRHPPAFPRPRLLTINPRATPVLTLDQAAARVAQGWLPFLFYTDADTRGRLMYRRYDGQLAVITPAGSDPHPRTLPLAVVAR